MNNLSDALAGTHTPLDRLQRALAQDLSLGKSKLEMDFREAYPVLEQHLIQRMRKRLAMERFNAAYGYKLNQAQFRKLLNAERERRKEAGDVVVCTGCGRSFHETATTEQGEAE
ncbi:MULTISPECIES: hypothetical protein [Stenotrophomonas]|uniref:Uncharacterized protein n=1 Tax=Stenotrophomonas maltophilia TaxID=40324 RepID=A0A1A6Y2J4_STEMA|nr:hypothetical protein [Stenotrophomonas maltophilia]OBU58234.1 hypothetical protein A9K70_06930 [Stenotrophomonas maltophilia]OBU66038.1 hypothetical protein A9K58_12940 [Stenotrophomonas maltophilia]OBU69413.1 hypothetical protein A9J40_03265 [Stenotrophomonas maltophilia]